LGTQHFSVLTVDIEKSGECVDPQMVDRRQALYKALSGAVLDAGIDWIACPHQDRGDGVQVIFPAGVAKEKVGGPVIRSLHSRLQKYNLALGPHDIPLRLRAALHAGELQSDPFGWTGYAAAVASRLMDSWELRSVLRQADAADLALIVSTVWYEAVVRHNRAGVRAQTYREVAVAVKELTERAWIHVPGYRLPPEPEPRAPSGPPTAGSGAPTDATTGGGVSISAGRDLLGGYASRDINIGKNGPLAGETP
jgi:hypothetical protein